MTRFTTGWECRGESTGFNFSRRIAVCLVPLGKPRSRPVVIVFSVEQWPLVAGDSRNANGVTARLASNNPPRPLLHLIMGEGANMDEVWPFPIDSIVTGDSLTLTRQLSDACIDLTITSPPYNLGNDHHTGNIRHRQYDDDLPEDEYQRQQINVLTELYRVTTAGGSVLYNHKNRIKNGQTLTPYAWILRTPWVLKQEIVWFNRSQNFDKVRFFPMTERVYWLAKSPQTTLFNAIAHHDVFDWQAVGTSGQHTRAFPEQFVRDMLACFPNARVVLDVYAGSGTVAAVCKQLGRHWLGFELDQQTAVKARQRVQNTQPPLFVPDALPEQLFMFAEA